MECNRIFSSERLDFITGVAEPTFSRNAISGTLNALSNFWLSIGRRTFFTSGRRAYSRCHGRATASTVSSLWHSRTEAATLSCTSRRSGMTSHLRPSGPRCTPSNHATGLTSAVIRSHHWQHYDFPWDNLYCGALVWVVAGPTPLP